MDATPDATFSTAEARDRFDDVINRAGVGKERLVLTCDGKPLAAIVPVEDLELLEELEDAADSALARERLAEWEASGRKGIPLDEVARKYGADLSEDDH